MKNLTYTKVGDYHLPDLLLPTEERELSFGKYGRMRKCYLEQNRQVLFINLLTSAKLNEHLHVIDVQAEKIIEQIVTHLAKKTM